MSTIGKILITVNNISEFLVPGSQNFVLTKDMILTPGAKDYLRNNSYRISFRDDKKENSLEGEIRRILESDFKIKSKDQLDIITKKVIAEKMGNIEKDSNRQIDPSGIMSVKGRNIKAEPFDTGKEGDKVGLTDLFSLSESPRLGAGIMELDNTTFEWTLNYDEVDYVIEGTLEIIIDGRKVVGKAGDVILIPKGSKIQFSTPDFTRFLYVVYPANWAEQG